MVKIYHNNRCSKSRCALKLLEESGKSFEVINYLEDIPTVKELTNIIKLLQIKPIELVRKNEAIWKENFKNQTLSNKEIVDAMVKYPKLIERPIVINGKNAIIGRPPESILDII
jgi:arsenate reductase